MQSILRCLPKCSRHNHHHRTFSTVDPIAATIKTVRDRGLDHAVEKERNLKPLLNLKNLIQSQPSNSLPLSIIAQNKDSLNIPTRPIDFIRKYPSIFQEFLPGAIGIHPHVKLTPQVLHLHAEECFIYQSQSYKHDVADRLFKLLMIARVNKIPFNIIDSLKWDLGLPQDYMTSIVPDFPDYFLHVVRGNDQILELVCWSDELAVSIVEKAAMSRRKGGSSKGTTYAFALQYSRGFEMEKKYKKWLDEWQKLPYISPYENALHLCPTCDKSDKWAVAVLHEVLNLFVPRKAERETILRLGEYLGLRSRFKRALLHHPGIFYLSSKIGTHTVVLREAYKRDLLIKKQPLMTMRLKYIHLMNLAKEDCKTKSVQDGGKQEKMIHDSEKEEREELENDESEEEQDEELHGMSDSEIENRSDDVVVDDDDDDDEDESAMYRGRTTRNINFEANRSSTAVAKSSARKSTYKTMEESRQRFSRKLEMHNGKYFCRR